MLFIAEFIVKILAVFNHKIELGVQGRAESFELLEKNISREDTTFWFHCASLGEYEQGLPIFKELRKMHPSHKIVLTFFSPSGYEIRKNTTIADVVIYLPIDTRRNAKRFVELVNPELTIFVKYDIWPNYLKALQKKKLKAILISASFRKDQSYFKFYGGMMREALSAFDHIFVQNEGSSNLLNSISIKNVTLAGDTRFDRVTNQLEQDNALPFINEFKDDKLCIVIGSSWPEDEAVFLNYINTAPSEKLKFIIAPHNIKQHQINDLVSKLRKKTIKFSEKEGQNLAQFEVLIIDAIGILSKIYSYADIAYVGGAMGNTGLHNILEPAVFGVPIIIGKNYKKFPEAFEMINHGGVFTIKNRQELENLLTILVTNPEERKRLGELNSGFIKRKKGAVVQIMNYIKKLNYNAH